MAAALLAAGCANDGGSDPADPEVTAATPTVDSERDTTTTTPPTTGDPTTTFDHTTTVTSSTATSTSTTTSTTGPTTPPPERTDRLALIDLEDATFAGWPLVDPAEVDLVDRLTETLGEPTAESGWLPMPPKLACTGNLDYRNVHWGDVRVVVERRDADDAGRAEAWSVGLAEPGIAPQRDVFDLSPASGVTTTQGVGIGDPVTEIDVDNMFGQVDPSTYQVAGARAIVIETNADGLINGFASGRNDCIGLDISTLPCERPIPIFRLPDGGSTGDVSVDEGAAFWGLERGVDTEYLVTEILGGATDADLVELARDAPINAQSGPVDVRLVPTGDPGVGAATIYVFDDRTECERELRLRAGLSLGTWESYVGILADDLNPRR